MAHSATPPKDNFRAMIINFNAWEEQKHIISFP